jgi:hypothetical protein
MTNTNLPPISILEANAQAQRAKLHDAVVELRSTVQQKLNAKKLARERLGTVAGVASVLGLLLGYGLTGIFTRD